MFVLKEREWSRTRDGKRRSHRSENQLALRLPHHFYLRRSHADQWVTQCQLDELCCLFVLLRKCSGRGCVEYLCLSGMSSDLFSGQISKLLSPQFYRIIALFLGNGCKWRQMEEKREKSSLIAYMNAPNVRVTERRRGSAGAEREPWDSVAERRCDAKCALIRGQFIHCQRRPR